MVNSFAPQKGQTLSKRIEFTWLENSLLYGSWLWNSPLFPCSGHQKPHVLPAKMWDKHLCGYKKAEKQNKNSEIQLQNCKLQFIKVRQSRYRTESPGDLHMLLWWHWLSISHWPLTKLLWGAGLLHPQAAVSQLRLRLPVCFNTLFPLEDDFGFQLSLQKICNSCELKYFSWYFEYIMAFTEGVKWQVITETTAFGKAMVITNCPFLS